MLITIQKVSSEHIKKVAPKKEIGEYEFDNIPEDDKISVDTRGFIYAYGVLEEYMRFFHQLEYFQNLESVLNFSGITLRVVDSRFYIQQFMKKWKM